MPLVPPVPHGGGGWGLTIPGLASRLSEAADKGSCGGDTRGFEGGRDNRLNLTAYSLGTV